MISSKGLYYIFVFVACVSLFTSIYSIDIDSNTVLIFGGDSHYPPYEYLDDDMQPSGFNVDLMKAISEVMGLQVNFELNIWSETLANLADGKISGLLGLAYSPTRARDYTFSRPHNYLVMSIFINRENRDVKSDSDLTDKKIIVQKNGVMHDYLMQNPITDQIILVDSPEDALLMLSENYTHVALLNRDQCLYLAKQMRLTNITIVSEPILEMEYAFAVLPERNDIIAAVDEGLQIIRNTGQYQKIYDKWFSGLIPPVPLVTRITDLGPSFLIPTLIAVALIILLIAQLRFQVRKRTKLLSEAILKNKENTLELLKSKNKYEKLVETLPEAVFEMNLDFKLTYLNQTAFKIFGYEPSEVSEDFDVFQLFKPQDRIKVKKELKNLIDRRMFLDTEYEVFRKDGSIIHVRFNTHLNIVEGETIGYIGIIVDLSSQKKTEKAQKSLYQISEILNEDLAEQEFYEKIHFIVKDLMPAENFCIATYDNFNDLIEYPYNIDLLNDCAVSRKPGRSLTDLVLKSGESQILKIDDLKRLIKDNNLSLAGVLPQVWIGVPLKVKNEIIGVMSLRDYNDENIYEEEEKQILIFISERVATSIERKLHQDEMKRYLSRLEDLVSERTEALEKSEKQFKTLSENSKEVIMRFDKEHRHMYVNPAVEDQTGISPQDFIGKTHKDMGFPEDLVQIWGSAIEKVFATRKSNRTEFMLPNGIWIDWHLTPEFSGDKKEVESVLATSYNITERKKFEEKIRSLNEELEERVMRRTRQLQEEIVERRQSEVIRKIQLEISELVATTEDSEQLYKEIHRVISQLLPAENFYIALYDEADDIISFPYNVDEYDPTPEPKKAGKGLTEYVLRTGKSLLANLNDIRELEEKGEVVTVGEYSKIFLGVPLRIKDKTVGIIAVQDYHKEDTYVEKDKQLLTFVSEQIALTLERKDIIEEINLQKNYFEQLYENMPIGLVLVDTQDIVRRINKAFTNIFEFTEEEVVGKKINEIIADKDHFEEAEKISDRTQRGNIILKETVRYTKHKKPVHVRIYGVPVIIKHKQVGIYGIYENISKRKEAEINLKKSEARYRTIFENTGTTSVIVDKNHYIIMANKEFEILSGYRKEDVVNKLDIFNFVTEEQRDFLLQLDRRRRIGDPEVPDKYEGKFITKDKSIKNLIVSVALIPETENKIVSMIDITDLKKAEQFLFEEKERLAVMLRSIGDGVIATDTSGNIILINKIAEQLTGWYQDEAFGRALGEVFHIISQDDKVKCDDLIDKVLSTGQTVELANHTILVSKSGKEYIIEDSAAPIRDRSSNLIGIIIVFRDITEKEGMELELQKTAKLESIGVLAGGIAHDFNNILTAILGNITLAKMFADQQDDKISLRLGEAEKATLRAKDITQQLLTFSKGGSPIRKTTMIKEAIIDAAKFGIHGSNVSCEFSIPDDLSPVEADLGQISQVINNLVINASHAMPNGGNILISGENVVLSKSFEPQKRVSVRKFKKGKYIKISVKDTGIGMSDEILDKVFEPFFTTKKQGSGLGLASSYSIIKKHDGFITVDSKLGNGTCFDIYLPSTDKSIDVEDVEKFDSLLGEGNVILMDDDEVLINVAKEMLKELGYKCFVAKDGEEAILLYSDLVKNQERVAALIIDLTIPAGLGGKDTIDKLRKINPDIKAIVSSGYSSDPIMAEYKKYGFKGVLPKPYTTEELGIVLKRVIEGV